MKIKKSSKTEDEKYTDILRSVGKVCAEPTCRNYNHGPDVIDANPYRFPGWKCIKHGGRW
jgi:hypothetical protein